MKAIIEVAKKGSAVSAARQQLAVARRGRTPEPMPAIGKGVEENKDLGRLWNLQGGLYRAQDGSGVSAAHFS